MELGKIRGDVLLVEIRRELNPDIIDKIKTNFVGDGSYSRDVMCQEFVHTMTFLPDSIFVLVGYVNNEIVGHFVAYKPENRNYVFLDQAWNISTIENSKIAFDKLKEWTKSIGLNEIRFATKRDSVAYKFWGFEQHLVILQMIF